MSDEQRGPWYLITGLIIGAVLGLVYAWVIQPVQYVDTAPASLRRDFKDNYRALIAAAFAANGDLVRAKARLELLGDSDVYRTLAEQAQHTLAEDSTSDEAQALGLLALAVGQAGPAPLPSITIATQTVAALALATTPSPSASPTSTEALSPTQTFTPTPTPSPFPSETPTSTSRVTNTVPPATPTAQASATLGTPTETPIPRPTGTPTQTRTRTPTSGPPFVLISRQRTCDVELEQPLIQVEALNILGKPVPGVLVIVAWDDGEERFYTGLKPERGLGYADYTIEPGVIYNLRLGEAGEPVANLSAVNCTAPSGEPFYGAWVLRFVQP